MRRLLHRLEFWIERQMVRGAQYRLAVIAAVIGLISVIGGALALWGAPGFEDLGEAVWWAFLRLTDPGYLGDDEGTVRRIVSTALTVLGYVVFLGALIAVMTQWLNARMEKLAAGLTPVARDDHILVLGWTNRTVAIVEDLLLSENRVRRFLRLHGARRLHIVVLAERVTAQLAQDFRDQVGEEWDERRITLRSGTPLRVEHLERVDFLNAAAIIVPATDFAQDEAGSVDTRTIKTLLSLGARVRAGDVADPPYTVVEILDARKIPAARRAYAGPLEVVATDAVVGRLLTQNVRHRGLSDVYNELLASGEGNEVYIRELPGLAGRSLDGLAEDFPRACLLGVVRPAGDGWRPHLNPPPGFTARDGDRFVLLAGSYEDAGTIAEARLPPPPRGEPGTVPLAQGLHRRVLVLGWNHRVPSLVREFATYPGETYEVDVASAVPLEGRERLAERLEVDAGSVTLRQLRADYTDRAELQGLEPAAYDSIVFVGSDWLSSDEESDARTILGYLLLGELLAGADRRPGVLLELLDPQNVELLERGEGEVLVSPLILSHMLGQVALRRELRAVFDELFTAGGPEISFRPPRRYGLAEPGVTFAEVRRAASARGETALGIRISREGPHPVRLNPAADSRWDLSGDAAIVTVVTYAARPAGEPPGGTARGPVRGPDGSVG